MLVEFLQQVEEEAKQVILVDLVVVTGEMRRRIGLRK